MSPRDEVALRDYLGHILESIQRIQRYLSGVDREAFLASEEKQDAVIRNLEVIGEASGNIRRHFPDFARQYPEYPLGAAYGTRNALAHGYFKVDLDLVWNTVERDLPGLAILTEQALSRH